MLSIGIVGLPNVGKSTLFNALTEAEALAANYPFATIEPNTALAPVPDPRLEALRTLYNAPKVIPATVTFVDIAGLVAGASKGEGLGNRFLANIRECQAIVHVVRAFENDDITHVANHLDPAEDIAVINTELQLADLQTVEQRLPKLQKEAKANPALRSDVARLEHAKEVLARGELLVAHPDLLLGNEQLLTAKPVVYAFNIDEATLNNKSAQERLASLVAPAESVFICAKLEEEVRGLEPDERAELLAGYNIEQSGLEQLIVAAYRTLGLQSYLTAGPKEVRAWTIPRGATAPQAAGVIHTDFERGFIAAQVVDFDDLIAAGSEAAAKAAGKVRTEGRDYVMRPGDVVEFRFNVSK